MYFFRNINITVECLKFCEPGLCFFLIRTWLRNSYTNNISFTQQHAFKVHCQKIRKLFINWFSLYLKKYLRKCYENNRLPFMLCRWLGMSKQHSYRQIAVYFPTGVARSPCKLRFGKKYSRRNKMQLTSYNETVELLN